jgi:hypothetical protein
LAEWRVADLAATLTGGLSLAIIGKVVLCLPARAAGTALGITSFGWLNGTSFHRVMLAALQPLTVGTETLATP